MTTETITDYETQEVTRERTVCDMPNCIHTDEDTEFQELKLNPTHAESHGFDVIEVYEDEREAYQRLDDAVSHTATMNMADMSVGYGLGRRTTRTDLKASATIDVCESCLIEMLAVDVDPGEIEEINHKTDGVEVVDKSLITIDGGLMMVLSVLLWTACGALLWLL